MNDMMNIFYYSIFGAAFLLSILGLFFTVIIPAIDSWSRRFFMRYFIVFLLCCLSFILEIFILRNSVSKTTVYIILAIESLLMSVPLPMLTVYMLHCCGENIKKSRLLYAVFGVWAVYCILTVSSPFIGGITVITTDNLYYRGPLYPLLVLPLIAIEIINLAGTLKFRCRLSRKVFIGLIVSILPFVLTLVIHIFTDVFPLIDICFVLSGLTMYAFILSDQIDQDRRHQQEIARQQQEIANERASVMVLRMRPHFIYNTLMSIYSLCKIDPMKARRVTMDFTNYLRRNFNAVASDGTVPFSTELEHTRAYLAVEQVQHEDMLLVDYDTQFTRFRLPPLTLQPLVENAVKHGLDPNSDPLHVIVRTQGTDTGIEITVEDNGPGFDPSDECKPHPTLTNISQRLELMCGGRLSIEAAEPRGTRVTIFVPYSEELSSTEDGE